MFDPFIVLQKIFGYSKLNKRKGGRERIIVCMSCQTEKGLIIRFFGFDNEFNFMYSFLYCKLIENCYKCNF